MRNMLAVFVWLLLVPACTAFAVDDRGNTATQGADTWVRAAQSMTPKPRYVNGHLTWVPPVKIEVSHLMDPAAPQSRAVVPHAQSHPVLRSDRCDARFSRSRLRTCR
jgi:hypothetical protein